MKTINSLRISGRDVLPLVEGGKGIAVTTGQCSGAWAAAGGVATFSAVNADSYDAAGHIVPQYYKGRTRRERHEEMVAFAIEGGITQARVTHDMAGGQGAVHVNVLWEMGSSEAILEGVLEGARGLIHGVTCGAGMPYRVAEIATRFGVYYYPIVSSARAFRALWLRSYRKFAEFLGGVVYEDPWLAGGHNGLSNSEDPLKPENPYPRVLALRQQMREYGLDDTPIFMAGGVWSLADWQDWIDNPELGPIAFQFGTRPLLTVESPISDAWKKKLLTLKRGDVSLNRFSPTGFYSSAVRNAFLRELEERSARQIPYALEPIGTMATPFQVGTVGKPVYLTPEDLALAQTWTQAGFTRAMRTPENTLIFVTPEKGQEIQNDQISCVGCLSACQFSNWAQNEEGTTGRRTDPRSFCIQKTLQGISHTDDIEHYLMFSGHNAYRFGEDPYYANGFIPTVRQLIERLVQNG